MLLKSQYIFLLNNHTFPAFAEACRRDGYGFKYIVHTQSKCQKMTHISEANIVERLKRESHCIFVQLLKRLDKCDKALAAIRFVGAENAVKAFLAVIRDPGKLSAVVV